MGRSMGSGPSTALASQNPSTAALVLLSPYTSLKNAVKSILGSIPAFLVKERFTNEVEIQKVTCPTLLIHGKKDDLIPCHHSVTLYENCKGPAKLHMPKNMTHNEFVPDQDILLPLRLFLKESGVKCGEVKGNVAALRSKFFHPPDYIRNWKREGLKTSYSQSNLASKSQGIGHKRERSPFEKLYEKIGNASKAFVGREEEPRHAAKLKRTATARSTLS